LPLSGSLQFMPVPRQDKSDCPCTERPDWFRLEDDSFMRWPVLEAAEWEELRQCPECGASWVAVWPEEIEAPPILCRPHPADVRRLKDLDRAATMRAYCLARLAEHLGELKEGKQPCRKVRCDRRRLNGSNYCLEHLIAEHFGRELARLGSAVGKG
jgi:hypothetical protein